MKLLITLLAILLSQNTFAVATSGCHTSYKKTIESLQPELVQRLSELNDRRDGIPLFTLPYVRRNFVEANNRNPSPRYNDHNRTYVSFHNKVKNVVSKMQTKVQKGFTYVCKGSKGRCKGGEVYAYVMFLGNYAINKIYLCESFFKEDHEEQLRTTMHELSHLAGNTKHYFGTIFNDAGMVEEANNAYFYEKLMFNDHEQIFRRQVWGFLWARYTN